jgi:hypothetical protein
MKPSVVAVDLHISEVEIFKKHCMSNGKGKRKMILCGRMKKKVGLLAMNVKV